MNLNKTILSVLCLCITGIQANAATLPSTEIRSYKCEPCTLLSHESLNKQWSLHNINIHKSKPNQYKSKSHHQAFTAKQLKKGVQISTSSPKAIIRITSKSNAMPHLIMKKQSNLFQPLSAFGSPSREQDFSGLQKQTVLQLKENMGFGEFELKSNDNDATDITVHVFEPQSNIYLDVSLDKLSYQYGNDIQASIALKDPTEYYPINTVRAYLVGPNKENIEMDVERVSKTQYKAISSLSATQNTAGENWYVEVLVDTVEEDKHIMRQAHAALSYSIPSATLTQVQVDNAKVTFDINCAVASRFSMQAVLFLMDKNNTLKPLASIHNSQWFEAGQAQWVLPLSLTESQIKQAYDAGKLYLGDVRVIDYGQLKPVYETNKLIKVNA